jgi:spore coat polysaccharide biosynthesis protein SpsF (cytidylyltransferase family)
VKRVFRYLKGTLSYGILYSGRSEEKDILKGYSDSDYAGCVDSRLSRTGFIFEMNQGPVTWQSKKQKSIATSTTEAEYVTCCTTAKETVWLRRLLDGLNRKQRGATRLGVDNQSTIRLFKNAELHQRTKHINVQYHFVRQEVKNGSIEVQ